MKQGLMLFAVLALSVQTQDFCAHVDPYVGCSYNGHCFAAACVPFGMVQAGPDTGYVWWDYCSGYRYADTNILGFSRSPGVPTARRKLSVKSVTLNGKPIADRKIRHEDIVKGGELVFEMTNGTGSLFLP